MAETPYEARKSQEWAAQLLKALTKQYVGDDVLFTGQCPRCEHRFTQAVPYVTSTLFEAERTLRHEYGTPPEPKARQVIFTCRCDEPHPNRPPDGHGCGASGKAEVLV